MSWFYPDMNTENRNEVIQLRVSQSEKAAISAAAVMAGLAVSSYIRARTIPKKPSAGALAIKPKGPTKPRLAAAERVTA